MQKSAPLTGKENNPARKKSGDGVQYRGVSRIWENNFSHKNDGNNFDILSHMNTKSNSRYITGSGFDGNVTNNSDNSRSDFKTSNVDGDDGNSEEMNSMLEANGVSSLIPTLNGSEMETGDLNVVCYIAPLDTNRMENRNCFRNFKRPRTEENDSRKFEFIIVYFFFGN